MKTITRVTILGGGPGALGFAIDCLRRNIQVLIFVHKDHQRTRHAIEKQGFLSVMGQIEGWARLDFTCDPQRAANFSTVFVMSVRGDVHDSMWLQFKDIRLDSHLILFIPGSCAEQNIPPSIQFHAVFQTLSTPISTLPVGDEAINVVGIKACLTMSGTQSEYRRSIEALLNTNVDWAVNEFDLVTQNPSGIFHPPMMIGNADRIQKGEKFRIYVDGLTPSTIAMLLRVDEVRCNIRLALGFPRVDVVDALNKAYATNFSSIEQFRDESITHSTLEAPPTLHHRMLDEDIRVHWVLWYEIGQLLGVDATPLREGIQKACLLCGEDFFQTGTTLKKLGFSGLSRDDFVSKFGGKAMCLSRQATGCSYSRV